jgi:hypothetical protein
VTTSLFDVSVLLSAGLCLLMCTALLQHLISLREPVHARPAKKGRRNKQTTNILLAKKQKWCVRRTHRCLYDVNGLCRLFLEGVMFLDCVPHAFV